MQKVIDAHTHLSERRDDALKRFAQLKGLRYTLEELLSTMRKYNIERGLLLSPPLQGTEPLPNDEIIKLCRRSEGMLVPVITVEPTAKEVKAAIKMADENKGEVKAFKVRLGYTKASADSPVFDRLYDYVGNPWFEDAAELVYKHPKVCADISGLVTGEGAYAEKYAEWLARRISEAIYYAGGAEKVIFGSDYPVSKHSDALDLVRRLEIDEGDKEGILWRNAERVFNL